jgi:N-dimethylarginine dimethylaminohydrolase
VLNKCLLMSDAKHFSVEFEINPYMNTGDQPDHAAAIAEHDAIVAAHRAAGRRVEYLSTVPGCPDMVYTANAALVRGNKAVLAQLPPERRAETPHYRKQLESRGLEVIDPPYLFSGQGDALPCGNLLLAGAGWRTDPRMHEFLRQVLGYHVVSLQTVSDRWYDIDLALAVIENPHTLAYCPEAFDEASRRRLRGLGLDLVEVAADEAESFALNLVSDGTTVTMTEGAPRLAAALRERGLTVVELKTTELKKGGGGIRCTSLTLDNP